MAGLKSFDGYLTPGSGRPTYALKWTLVNQQASDDYEQKRRYIGSTLIIWLLFLPVLLVLGGIMTLEIAWLDSCSCRVCVDNTHCVRRACSRYGSGYACIHTADGPRART